jgi:peptidoglycan/LPS O-acetylase OafA/YrhL
VVSRWRLGHRPELDGLRGVAILLVLTCHEVGAARSVGRLTAIGAAGVTLFFTLSGFLITALLLEERADRGRIDLRRFYVRRARRLLPALVLVLIVFDGMAVIAGESPSIVLPILLYFANWASLAGADLGLLSQTWTLSVEEQFYLIWPVVLIVSLRWRRGPLVVSIAGAAVSLLLRFTIHDGRRIFYGSDTQAFGLLVGAALAVLALEGLRERKLPGWATAALVLSLFALTPVRDAFVGFWVVPVVVPIAGAALIWSGTGPVLTNAPLRYLGRRSYAIYLWHFPLIVLFRDAVGASALNGLMMISLSIAFAELSWRVVERPFLRRRSDPAASPDDPQNAVPWGSHTPLEQTRSW